MKLTMPEGLGLLGVVIVGTSLVVGSQAAQSTQVSGPNEMNRQVPRDAIDDVSAIASTVAPTGKAAGLAADTTGRTGPREISAPDSEGPGAGKALITKVEIRGRKAVPLKEIEDATGLKAGKRAGPARTWLAVNQILRLYQQKGYALASVTLLEGDSPGDTKIVIEIFEGPKVRIGSVHFTGNIFASDHTLSWVLAFTKPGTTATLPRSGSQLVREISMRNPIHGESSQYRRPGSTTTSRSSSIITMQTAFSG